MPEIAEVTRTGGSSESVPGYRLPDMMMIRVGQIRDLLRASQLKDGKIGEGAELAALKALAAGFPKALQQSLFKEVVETYKPDSDVASPALKRIEFLEGLTLAPETGGVPSGQSLNEDGRRNLLRQYVEAVYKNQLSYVFSFNSYFDGGTLGALARGADPESVRFPLLKDLKEINAALEDRDWLPTQYRQITEMQSLLLRSLALLPGFSGEWQALLAGNPAFEDSISVRFSKDGARLTLLPAGVVGDSSFPSEKLEWKGGNPFRAYYTIGDQVVYVVDPAFRDAAIGFCENLPGWGKAAALLSEIFVTEVAPGADIWLKLPGWEPELG